jgi:hypothetical protein
MPLLKENLLQVKILRSIDMPLPKENLLFDDDPNKGTDLTQSEICLL